MEDGGRRFHSDRSPTKFRGWLANPPAGEARGDCFAQSLDFGLQVGICDERRAQRRAWIPTANRNSRVYVRFKENSGGGLGLCRVLRSIHVWTPISRHQNRQRTQESMGCSRVGGKAS